MGQSCSVDEKPKNLRRLQKVSSGIITFILFLTVLIYAGLRGYLAYHGERALVTSFQPNSTIPFPAVLICPIDPNITYTSFACSLVSNGAIASSCANLQRTFVLFGVSRGCMDFNNQALPLSASLPGDNLNIQLTFDATVASVDEALGSIAVLHQQAVEPVVAVQSSFVTDVGKLTLAWTRMNTLVRWNDTPITTFESSAFPVSFQSSNLTNATNSLIEINLTYTQLGSYVSIEFLIYETYQWFGEVGGFACLMMILHDVVVFLIVTIAACTPAFKRGSANSGY